jgi:hypothetical protein
LRNNALVDIKKIKKKRKDGEEGAGVKGGGGAANHL